MKKVSSIFSVLLITLFLAPHSFGEEQKKKPEENNPNFHKQLLEVAGKYESYGKVNDLAKWAPWLCRMPPPPKASFSKAEKSPHGRKLYFLYAADRNQYFENKPPQVGQVIVKESWIPENNEPSKKFGLFIMMKLDPENKRRRSRLGIRYSKCRWKNGVFVRTSRIMHGLSCPDQK